jgi:heme/copper-type cytochrome/quinol oxidase subunit 3
VAPDGAAAQAAIPTESELQARNLWAGGRLLVAAMAFVFIALVFAFYYLRQLNIQGLWRPAHVHPPLTFGLAILACILASVIVYWLGTRNVRVLDRRWLWPATAALALALTTLVLIGFEIPDAGFRPTDGAYASVFFAWTGFYAFAVFGGAFYMETLVARGLRLRTQADPVVLTAEVEAFGIYWYFIALMTILTFVLLYVVA